MYRDRLRHGSLYKLHVHGDNGWKDRIPAYATRVVQDEATKNYTAQFWAPEPFDWRGDAFDASKNGSLLIYEAAIDHHLRIRNNTAELAQQCLTNT